MTKAPAAFFFAVVVSISNVACAEPQPCNMSNLWKADTAGVWRSGESMGYYRVLLLRAPGEPAVDEVCVQIVERKSSGEMKTVRTISVSDVGYRGTVSGLVLKTLSGNRIAIAIDVAMRGMEDIEAREIYVVGIDGKSRKISEAKFVDIED